MSAKIGVTLLMIVTTLSSCRDNGPVTAVQHEYFVSPAGSALGDGSRKAPWDLATALAHPQSVGPDDLIWLLEGTYQGNFLSSLAGGEGHVITVRQAAGQRATIDGTLEIRGQYAVYRGFEVFNSNPVRVTDSPGVEPANYQRPTAVVMHGPHTKIVNLIIHDSGTGVGLWADAINAEVHGCLIYNNGWDGPDGGHGVGIASQNAQGTKRIINNIIFQQFDKGVSLYGSDQAQLSGFDIEGNVSFFNGAVSKQRSAWDFFFGGGVPIDRLRVLENYSFRRNGMPTARFGYEIEVVNEDMVLSRNYLVGQTELMNWKKLTLTDNVFTGAQNLLSTRLPKGVKTSAYSWSNNEFVVDTTIPTQGTDQPFQLIQDTTRRVFDLNGWKRESGLGDGSTESRGHPADTRVFARKSEFDGDRAHIVVYNWTRLPNVEFDASELLETGDSYELRAANDYFGSPVATGVYQGHKFGLKFLSGGKINIPMAAGTRLLPIGASAPDLETIGPDFGVFVLQRISKPTK